MSTIGNILWFLFGGLIGGLAWVLAGCLWCITIIGIPVGLQCFKFASLAFFPFGKEVVYGGGGFSFLVNLIWIIKKYKDNWDNEHFVSGNHNQVLTYQNRARKNMLGYQKKIAESIGKKPHIVTQAGVKQAFTSVEKEFKYYRLSLYTFSLSSLMEVMLSGNFKESYISGIRDELQQMSDAYHDLFEESSHYLEKLSNSAVDANVMKGIGTAGNAVGKFIGSIPLVKEGPVDEFLQDGGIHLKKSALDMEKDAVHRFASIGNPGTRMFMEKMDEMIQIYNRTEQICFDDKKIYLLPKKLAV